MLKMVGGRSPSPTTRTAAGNNSANNGDETNAASGGRSGRKSWRNKKTATIDDSRDIDPRRPSSIFGRSSPPPSSQDDSAVTCAPQRKLSRNMATSRTVRVKPTYKAGDGNRFVRPMACMSPGQKQAVLNTWRHLKEHYGERATEQILQKLINDQPKIKDLFYQAAFLTAFTRSSNSITTFRDHSRLLHRAIDDLIENLDNRAGCEKVLKELRENGVKHAFLRKSGFKADTWERFGEVAIDVLNGYECVKANPEASKGWCVLIASITDELRSGFETEARKQSYCVDRPKSACD